MAGVGLFLDWLVVVYGVDLGYGEFDMGGVVFAETIKGDFRVERAAAVLVSVIIVSVLAAFWPAFRAARLRPIDAMRTE